ncbi:MAG: biotin carboxylase, partial [Bacteroidia bacterium]|nr:biotin carboxylase [Bacteroidia bacterium]
IQVMADNHGKVLHFFERECSIQRRHQKVVEEAPSSVLTEDLRQAMGKAATDVARSCDYVGAGTVEFLFDADQNFYFLEMNTRLQVEHPVTELITGVDLVELQIRVARNEKLELEQEDIKISGHALELRVYAEDPMNDFLPSVGKLERYEIPAAKGIRVDDGFEQGLEVPIYYDPLLSKLITYGKNREPALEMMIKAIDNYKVSGIATTLPFGKFVCKHEAFRSGEFDTHFVQNHFSAEALENQDVEEAELAALIGLYTFLNDKKNLRIPN